jgi:glycosyltransferase involved in cell wall biosynthesis
MTLVAHIGNSAALARNSECRERPVGLPAHDLHVVHVTSSRFFGGPERQMLELARELAPDVASTFVSFSEENLCQDFLQEVRNAGFIGIALKFDTPRLLSAAGELTKLLKNLQATLLCAHGYKASLLGLTAARTSGIPVVAVSRGWTAESWKVRLYEKLDRLALRRMDKVVCVSQGQADKVRLAGVTDDRIVVIHNAIRTARFDQSPVTEHRGRLEALFPVAPRYILGAAGRLSPEKGFDVLIAACKRLRNERQLKDFGVALFGNGALRDQLQKQIDASGLSDRFCLAGFTAELDRFMPRFDLFVQSSHTEGLPNVLLEAAAAGVPVVATDVGGTAEVVVHEETGLVVRPNDPPALAAGLHRLLSDDALRAAMQARAPRHVASHFTFAAQAASYRNVFHSAVSRATGAN